MPDAKDAVTRHRLRAELDRYKWGVLHNLNGLAESAASRGVSVDLVKLDEIKQFALALEAETLRKDEGR